MSWTKISCFFAICALLAAPVMAQPTASLSGVQNGAQYDWTLSFTPDDSLFFDYGTGEGTGDALGISFQLETAEGGLVASSFAVEPNFLQTLDSVDIVGVGFDPYNGGNPTEGVTEYTSVASVLDTGTKDALFVPLGSDFFTAAGDYAALTFSTTTDTVWFGGDIAQDNNNGVNTDDIYTIAADSVTIGSPGLPGDLNGDGFVGAGDLGLVLNNWGANATPVPAGWIGIPQPTAPNIGSDDLGSVLTAWGNGVAPAAIGTAAVPEPASVAMVLFGIAAGVLYKKTRS